MKKILMILATVALLASCSNDDDPIKVKDYGLKTFSADMKYEKTAGMAKDFSCKQQTYFKLGKTEAVATGEYGKDNWTTFNILPKIPNKEKVLVENPNYNVKTNIKNWDILFTQYVGNAARSSSQIFPYFLAGILINPERVQVALHKNTESKDANEIAKAFADLKISDLTDLNYTKTIDFIGINWRSMKGMPPTYEIKYNNFYIIKNKEGEIYKVRFIQYYGDTKAKKVFKCEYALMK